MSILSKPWRVSAQRSPNLLSFLTANEVQTRRDGSSTLPCAPCDRHRAQRKKARHKRAKKKGTENWPQHLNPSALNSPSCNETAAIFRPDTSLGLNSTTLNWYREAREDPYWPINTANQREACCSRLHIMATLCVRKTPVVIMAPRL